MIQRIVTLVVASSALVLAGCPSNSADGNTSVSQPLYKMSASVEGFSTFTESTNVTRSTPVERTMTLATRTTHSEPSYVFQSLAGGTVSVRFYGESSDITGVEIAAPEITSVRDINDQYTAMNFEDVTFMLDDIEHTGEYTLILDKLTGFLYPLTDQGKPILYKVVAEHEGWYNETRMGFVADDSRLYLRYSDSKSLHVAELIDNHFQITQIFDDYRGKFVVDVNGTVFRKNWDGGFQVAMPPHWTPTPVTSPDADAFFVLLNNQAHVRTGDALSEVAVVDGALELTSTDWSAPDLHLTELYVTRNDYLMNQDCSIFKFDKDTSTVTRIAAPEASGGRAAAAAANNAMFCQYGSINDDSTPKFKVFDVSDESLALFEATVGTSLHAGERLTVVSDKEIMFYEDPYGSFTEYYLKTNGDEFQKVNDTENVSIIVHLK